MRAWMVFAVLCLIWGVPYFFIKLALLDGNALLFTPAPQTAYEESRPADRVFSQSTPAPVAEQAVEDRLAKEIRFDSDVWIVEIEDRAGRHLLDLAKI